MVKFGMIAGAGNVVIFNRICSWPVRKVALAARRVQFCVVWVGSWQVQDLVKFMCHFSWQAQHLVKFMCHFSWQAQHGKRCNFQ